MQQRNTCVCLQRKSLLCYNEYEHWFCVIIHCVLNSVQKFINANFNKTLRNYDGTSTPNSVRNERTRQVDSRHKQLLGQLHDSLRRCNQLRSVHYHHICKEKQFNILSGPYYGFQLLLGDSHARIIIVLAGFFGAMNCTLRCQCWSSGLKCLVDFKADTTTSEKKAFTIVNPQHRNLPANPDGVTT